VVQCEVNKGLMAYFLNFVILVVTHNWCSAVQYSAETGCALQKKTYFKDAKRVEGLNALMDQYFAFKYMCTLQERVH
jgi:hypothetical protein